MDEEKADGGMGMGFDDGSVTEHTYDPRKGEKKTWKRRALVLLKHNVLLILLLLSLIIGITTGVLIRAYKDPPLTSRQLMYFRFPGDLLMRMLKCLIIPLIVSSLISGLAGLDAKSSGRLGLRAVVYYFVTTLIAVILGIILVMSIQPGKRSSDVPDTEGEQDKGNVADSFLDLIRNMFPDNIVEACFRQTKTVQEPVVEEWDFNTSTPYNYTPSVSYDPKTQKMYGMNVLGLVVFSVALGIVVSKMGKVGRPIYLFTASMAEATMTLVVVVIWYSPIGIIFLVASEIINMEDPIKELESLALYIATVMAGLAIHGFIILPLLYFIVVRKNPFSYMVGILQAMVTAFGTASSSATLPVTYRCLEVNNKIDPRVTRFVLPVGATINMDGTALYEAVAAIFIAQLNGMELGPADIVATSITATLASIGAASVPQAGLVTMVIVLTALGIEADQVTRILAIDWLLDRFRTAINVEGDSFGAGIIAHLSRKDLEAADVPDLSEAFGSYMPGDKMSEMSHNKVRKDSLEGVQVVSNGSTLGGDRGGHDNKAYDSPGSDDEKMTAL